MFVSTLMLENCERPHSCFAQFLHIQSVSGAVLYQSAPGKRQFLNFLHQSTVCFYGFLPSYYLIFLVHFYWTFRILAHFAFSRLLHCVFYVACCIFFTTVTKLISIHLSVYVNIADSAHLTTVCVDSGAWCKSTSPGL